LQAEEIDPIQLGEGCKLFSGDGAVGIVFVVRISGPSQGDPETVGAGQGGVTGRREVGALAEQVGFVEAKPLAERLLPDSPWRDVAGMLRSFDYAPRVVERTWAEDDPDGADVRALKAAEWANRSKNHFLYAYADGDIGDEQRTLLDAYVADKAVYETVYETRNRPTWVDIPLQAVAEIGAP